PDCGLVAPVGVDAIDVRAPLHRDDRGGEAHQCDLVRPSCQLGDASPVTQHGNQDGHEDGRPHDPVGKQLNGRRGSQELPVDGKQAPTEVGADRDEVSLPGRSHRSTVRPGWGTYSLLIVTACRLWQASRRQLSLRRPAHRHRMTQPPRSLMTSPRAQDTTLTSRAPSTADGQKLSTWNGIPSRPEIQLTSQNSSPLTTSAIRPRVSTYNPQPTN